MNKYILFVLFLLAAGFQSSQVLVRNHQIKWIFNVAAENSLVKQQNFTFEGAVYRDDLPEIPVYYEIFSVGKNENMVFEIRQPEFTKYDGKILDEWLKNIPEQIELLTAFKKSGEEQYVELHFVPIIKKGKEVFLLTRFDLKKETLKIATSEAASFAWKNSSVLASGKWVKIKTSKKGIHKITYDKLKSYGFTAPELVNIYGSGGLQLSESLSAIPVDDLVKNRTWRAKDASGKDCLFFYSTGNTSWQWNSESKIFTPEINFYTQECIYFLSQEGNSAHQVELQPQSLQPATHTVQAFDDFTRYESELYNLLRSGKKWWGEKFISGSNRTVSITCENNVPGKTATLLVNAAGRSSGNSYLDITFNQQKLSNIIFSPVDMENQTSLYADERLKSYQLAVNTGKNDVLLSYAAPNSLAEAWIDYIVVNWKRQLKLDSDELYFRDTESVGAGNTAQFQIDGAASGVKILDITLPHEITEVAASVLGAQLQFKRPAGELREYVAFKTNGNFPEAVVVGDVPNQNLHAISSPEMLIVTHPDFINAAREVAGFHLRNDGMKVEIVTTNQVFNEFGAGNPDATAIRNIVRMFYQRDNKLKYVLLFGDGSYDNRNLLGNKRNFVPTFQSDNALVPTSSFVSDDYFVILDAGESVYNGTVDLGIGRLPVSSTYEARIVVDKILNYYSANALGLWRNNVCFIADDEDGALHMSDSESLANQVNAAHREYQTDKIYLDAFQQVTTSAVERYPDVTDAINQRVKDGVLILNYVGHANDRYMADERVLDVSVINSWSNARKLPIFVTATCEFSRFDSDGTSAGEYILLNPNGGGIGLFSTSRVVYAYSNYILSQNFYKFVFEKDASGENFRMGDVMRLAKINTINTLNQRNFTLLADPALRLSYPKYKVITKTVNQRDAAGIADTLKALSKVTIKGEVVDNAGKKLTAFSGKVYPVVYDKAFIRKTLGNGGQVPFSYKTQNNVIYKGEASVVNGDFTFSFVVPKDISYNLAAGKILYYADNGKDDANGAFENFYIGGGSSSQIVDNKGPEVQLYIDDTSFQSGGKTSQNPLMLAIISDENGINTIGTGIGHDITAVLDDNYSNVFILNEYYTPAANDYTKGSLNFLFRNLSIGEHSLKLKVWDVANNSTETEIKFEVTGDFYISEVSNYPNPVSEFTNFTFTHNQPEATFSTMIEIFDLSGRRLDIIKTTIASNGSKSNPLRWDLAERGVNARNGIYPYRVTIKNSNGKTTSLSGKMLIAR